MDANYILGKLNTFKGQTQVLIYNQDTKDIIRGILHTHDQYKSEYDKIYQYFLCDTIEQSTKKVWHFLKNNVPYYIESENTQYLKSPSGILCTPSDCKSYSLFANGVMDAIKRNTNENFDVYYRFASYDLFDKSYQHVFSVIKTDQKEIWIDPVLNNYNEKKYPFYFMDRKIKSSYALGKVGALVAMSGIGSNEVASYGTDAANAAVDLATGNYLAAGSSIIQGVMTAIANAHGTDALHWQSVLQRFSDNVKAITYLDYIQTLPAETGGNGDSQIARFAQSHQLFPNMFTNGSVSFDIANAWNKQLDYARSQSTAADAGSADILAAYINISNENPSGFIQNGLISKDGVLAAANTGLLELATFQKQYASAPQYLPPVSNNSISIPANGGQGLNLTTILLFGGGGFLLYKLLSKKR